MSLLEVSNLTKRFGGLVANDRVSLSINEGEILGLIGPNGAGKTTLFNCIVGFYPPDEGSVKFAGREIVGLRPDQTCKLGLARTFQLVRVFKNMSVMENAMAGAFNRAPDAPQARREALALLEFAGLADKKHALAGSLTIADKKRLELTRALATKPKLLMLDEAMAGLTPKESQEAVALIRELRERWGLTMCLVEHVMEVIMPLSDRVVALDYGRKIGEGSPAEVARDESVIKAYLGGKHRAPR